MQKITDSEALQGRRKKLWVRLWELGGWTVSLVAVSLLFGTVGYVFFAGMTPLDGFLNAAMLLSGMGAVGENESWQGKLFAACFALYSAGVFLVISGFLLAPVLHHFIHEFHLEDTK